MPDFSTIMNEISARLSGDAAKDVAYLRNMVKIPRDGPDGLAVKRAISRLILQTAPASSVRAWRRSFRDASEAFERRLRSAREATEVGSFEEALDILSDLAAKVDGLFVDDEKNAYRRFRNPLEEAICERLLPSKKERRRPPVDCPGLYLQLGSALLKRRRTNDATNAFQKGLAFNPVDVAALLELSAARRRDGDDRERLRTTTAALRYSYTPRDLARCYRELGAFYADSRRDEFASYLFFFALTLDDAPETRRELRTLESRMRRAPKAPPFDKLRNAFEKEEVQLGPDPETVAAVRELAENARDAGNFKLARTAFDALFRLTGDAEFQRAASASDDEKGGATR